MEVTLDKFGRILIPKRIRDRLGLKPGVELHLEVTEGGEEGRSISLRPAPDQGRLIRKGNVLVFKGERLGGSEKLDAVESVKTARHARLDDLSGLEG